MIVDSTHGVILSLGFPKEMSKCEAGGVIFLCRLCTRVRLHPHNTHAAGADVCAGDSAALRGGVEGGHERVVDLLLKAGADAGVFCGLCGLLSFSFT